MTILAAATTAASTAPKPLIDWTALGQSVVFSLVIGIVMVIEMTFVLGASWGGMGPAADMGADYNNARSLGEMMYTEYAYAVQVGAALLLVGMIAAIALTMRGSRRDVRYNNASEAVRVKAKDRLRLLDIPAQERVNAKSGDQA